MTKKFCLYSEVPLITISRGIGCGGMIIARLVAEGLNLELFDDHKLEKELIEMGIRPKDIEDMDEKAPGLFDRILNKKPEVFLDYMDWNDPSLYDLVINTEQLGLDLAAKLIMESARSDQIKACSL